MAGRHVAFMSYARFDDDQYNGQLTEFRKLLSAEVRAQTGREFVIFQDREHIPWGESWQKVIDEALDTVALLLVIITPGFFSSEACRIEVARFLERERELGRSDLILPLYYISAREIDDPVVRESDELAKVLASRQYADWRDLRFEPLTSPTAHKAIGKLASRMTNTFWQTPPAQAARRARAPDGVGPCLEALCRADRGSKSALDSAVPAGALAVLGAFPCRNGVTARAVVRAAPVVRATPVGRTVRAARVVLVARAVGVAPAVGACYPASMGDQDSDAAAFPGVTATAGARRHPWQERRRPRPANGT